MPEDTDKRSIRPSVRLQVLDKHNRDSISADAVGLVVQEDYRDFTGIRLIGRGVSSRLDDGTLWILLAAMVLVGLMHRSVRRIPQSCEPRLASSLVWKSEYWVVYAAAISIAIITYLESCRAEPLLPIVGTFFCNSSIASIRTLQLVEGAVNVFLLCVGYIPLVLMFHLSDFFARQLRDSKVDRRKLLAAATCFLNSANVSIVGSIAVFIVFSAKFIRGGPADVGKHVLTLPFESEVIIVGVIAYSAPYVIALIRFLRLKPDSVGIRLTKTWFYRTICWLELHDIIDEEQNDEV
ncbi:MAG: hypothetical protein ABII79_05585 [bacterium]